MQNTAVKNVLLILIVAVVALALVYFITDRKNAENATPNETGAMSFYYRTDCPHCQNVEKYFADNKVEEKFLIEKKEVGENGKNNNEMTVRAQLCGLDISSLGVPFLYDHGTCYVGEEEIINYFEQRI